MPPASLSACAGCLLKRNPFYLSPSGEGFVQPKFRRGAARKEKEVKEQLAAMTIIELVKKSHEVASQPLDYCVTPVVITELASRLEALNLAYIGAMNNLRSATSATAIPEGYALVPQEMCLSAEAMEAICFHCGDGGFAFGEFTDGVLFVGDSEPEEGKKVHGLHIVTADYPAEGCAVICEFLPASRNGETV